MFWLHTDMANQPTRREVTSLIKTNVLSLSCYKLEHGRCKIANHAPEWSHFLSLAFDRNLRL